MRPRGLDELDGPEDGGCEVEVARAHLHDLRAEATQRLSRAFHALGHMGLGVVGEQLGQQPDAQAGGRGVGRGHGPPL